MSHADDNEYGKSHRKDPALFQDVLNGTAKAPAQYRVGVIRAADFLSRVTHLRIDHWVALIGLVCALVTGLSLFYLLKRSLVWKNATGPGRWFGAAAFLFLAQFYFAWVTYFQRPETLPTATVLALFLLLLSVRLPLPGLLWTLLTSLAFVTISVIQAFIRADVAIALNLGVLLYCIVFSSPRLALARHVQIATSIVACAAAAGIQYFLMHKVYPTAAYGDTERVQFFLNLKTPAEWPVFVIFLLPFGWTVWAVFRRRLPAEAPGKAMLFAALIFLAMWFTFGRIEEVRIFLPFALTLAPLTVACAIQAFPNASFT